MTEPLVHLDGWGAATGGWRFDGHCGTLSTCATAEVATVLQHAEAAAAEGCYAVGFVAYEAARALNPHLPSLAPQPDLPLAWFALFRQRRPDAGLQSAASGPSAPPDLQPTLERERYQQAVTAIHHAIAAGESYQINYSFPLSGSYAGSAAALYQTMLTTQRPPFGALLDTGRHLILSASPELFFHRQGGLISTRPMKGTAPRGRFPAEDTALCDALQRSAKEQAENLMIVDLLRNDLGQIAQTGSVQVERLFTLETYPTVHQLTSTISAQLQSGIDLTAIFRALFPCGSVTGAPKRRSMELIAQLEGRPRGVYCGAIGMLEPGGEAQFSVAIRTALLDRETDRISMGIGSGITWDAQPSAEYDECLTKGAFLSRPAPPRLLESLRLEHGTYPLLQRHLARLQWSAARLGHRYDAEQTEQRLREHATAVRGTHKVRLLLNHTGHLAIESAPFAADERPLKLALSSRQVDPQDPLLYLKTEDRTRYDAARAEHPAADEVLLVNTRGELTEGSYHSLVLRLAGHLVTPPLDSGLLPGVMRQELVDSGAVREQVLYPADLLKTEEIWLINAVRGWRRAELMHRPVIG